MLLNIVPNIVPNILPNILPPDIVPNIPDILPPTVPVSVPELENLVTSVVHPDDPTEANNEATDNAARAPPGFSPQICI